MNFTECWVLRRAISSVFGSTSPACFNASRACCAEPRKRGNALGKALARARQTTGAPPARSQRQQTAGDAELDPV